MNKATFLALFALVAFAAASAVEEEVDASATVATGAEMAAQMLVGGQDQPQFAELQCESECDEIAKENKKTRPTMIKELDMIQTVKHHLGRLINQKAETEAIQINNIQTGGPSSDDTLAGLLADVSTGTGRSYTETSAIQTLIHNLEDKLKKQLYKQRHALLTAVHNCMHICRDRHHAHRRELLGARKKRREAHVHYHGLERVYFKLKGEWEVLVREYKILKIETEKKIKVIDEELRQLAVLKSQMKRYLEINKGEAEAETETNLQFTDEDTARLSAVTKNINQATPLVAELLTSIQMFNNKVLTAKERHSKGGAIAKLLDELNYKLRAERAELLRILKLKYDEMKAKEREMLAAKERMDAYRPVLKRLIERVASLKKLCEDADIKCTKLENSIYINQAADGTKKGELHEVEKQAEERIKQEHAARKARLAADHNRLKSEEDKSEADDKETNDKHKLTFHPKSDLDMGEAMDNDQY